MQPLDLSFMSPLQTFYAQEIEQLMRRNNDKSCDNSSSSRIIRMCLSQSCYSRDNSQWFQKAGIYPCNKNIFRHHDFLSGETGLNKNSASLTIGEDRLRMSKEFDAVPASAQILTPIREAVSALCLL
jgi:hypothetical protein